MEVIHNAAASRFEARLDQGLAVADYHRQADRLVFFHTEVPFELRGRGIAGRVVGAALDYAQTEGLKVVPSCSYVRAFIRRHPEYAPLVA
jgi:predicted GNAT family acetyltransferase